jgi:hypothetical protein
MITGQQETSTQLSDRESRLGRWCSSSALPGVTGLVEASGGQMLFVGDVGVLLGVQR